MKDLLNKWAAAILTASVLCVLITGFFTTLVHYNLLKAESGIHEHQQLMALPKEDQAKIQILNACLKGAEDVLERKLCTSTDSAERSAMIKQNSRMTVYKACLSDSGTALEDILCNRRFGNYAADIDIEGTE